MAEQELELELELELGALREAVPMLTRGEVGVAAAQAVVPARRRGPGCCQPLCFNTSL